MTIVHLISLLGTWYFVCKFCQYAIEKYKDCYRIEDMISWSASVIVVLIIAIVSTWTAFNGLPTLTIALCSLLGAAGSIAGSVWFYSRGRSISGAIVYVPTALSSLCVLWYVMTYPLNIR